MVRQALDCEEGFFRRSEGGGVNSVVVFVLTATGASLAIDFALPDKLACAMLPEARLPERAGGRGVK